MFVHLGADTVIDVREVVAVLNVQRVPKSDLVRDLLDRAARNNPDVAKPRSVVVSTKGIFLSTISVSTVANRVQRMSGTTRPKTARSQTGQGFPPLTPQENQ